MIRIAFLLVIFLVGRAEAQPSPNGGAPTLDAGRIVSVYSEALAFMAPRILEPIPVSQLTLWGLKGLAAIDTNVGLAVREGNLLITRRGQPLPEILLPTDEAPGTWASVAAQATAALYSVSPPLRRAGVQTIIQAFFDELFSHLDPYSRYVPPVEAAEDRAQRSGRAGIGVTLERRGRVIVIAGVIRDSPASIAGIQPGEVILSIDGQRATNQDPMTISSLLAGAPGTPVALTTRSRDGRVREHLMTRVMVPPETVFAERNADVLVLRVTSFSQTTASHIALSVQDAMAEPRPVSGIVLDLRDNRGGLLRQAVTAADTFLPDGIIVTTAGRDPEAAHIWRSAEGELARNVPLVVLVDGRTASAAEVLAAALSDRGRAVVVGSSTVGKGLVQTIDPMPDGGELFVTWSRLIAPLGWPIQGLGVLPQVCTSVGADLLNRQIAALGDGVQPMMAALRMARASRVPVSPERELSVRAACPAAEGRAADLAVARRLIANPAAYAAALFAPFAGR
ncbi:MAG: S41 family peptidase [Acetobacteraceae bacterium]